MDGAFTIVEVMESSGSSRDGLPTETAELEPKQTTVVENLEDQDGPWNELTVVRRQWKMLESGFMADLTVTIQTETFRCHSYILSSASPQFAAMLRKNSHELHLHEVEPRHFRILLEIVYTDVANGLRDVNEVLSVARAAHNFRIHVAVAYCTGILKKQITVTHVFPILELALLIKDDDLKKACTKVACNETSTVLKSKSFKLCGLPVLELILNENSLRAVTELDLFQACARWAKTRENPRQALGSALSLIRFRLLTAQQFAKHVKPTKLLSSVEESDIFSCLVTGEGDMPAGFSNEKLTRSQVEFFKKSNEIDLKTKCCTPKNPGKEIPLQISLPDCFTQRTTSNLIPTENYSRNILVTEDFESLLIEVPSVSDKDPVIDAQDPIYFFTSDDDNNPQVRCQRSQHNMTFEKSTFAKKKEKRKQKKENRRIRLDSDDFS